mmetsp:Transcript_14939/g.29054  ORF Transcript_14939/g.29054 Transcript_14939/m.29054 type:complete len:274 (+) Transcript_14939:207-1028(+)|eukprot:CAMPEP_0171499148 /NCGR_PEP_ID=MMETSP0958-20121227/8273_1 /TAXON_ID=87120 /ORGANISM="Aurantiochytrium limacinum, Strain ATCCMYA-1381" /LENGTH=273 /DNA_ID=CAMNT_0012033683 /DNA_START=179 /DNA_END=1000 /DNA_ORIENTATION=+
MLTRILAQSARSGRLASGVAASRGVVRGQRQLSVLAGPGPRRGVALQAAPLPLRSAAWRHGGARSLFIQTEETPNPASLKFIPGKEVLPEEFGSSMEFLRDTPTNNSPLARLLMRLNGVNNVFLSQEYVTISKNDSVEWAQLKPEVFATIMDFYAGDKPAVTGPMEMEQDEYPDEDNEIVELIKELLEERIRPMVQEDGGDIFFKGFDEETGIVSVRLAGSCAGCPSSTVTLKHGVENMLMHYIPEVTGVHSIGELDESPDVRVLQYKQDDSV